MRRLLGSAPLVGGLGLLSAAGTLAGLVLLTQEEYRSGEGDHATEEERALVVLADPAAIPEHRVDRVSSAPSAPPRPGLHPRTGPRKGASQRATPRIPPMRSQPTTVGQPGVDRADEDDYSVDGETLRWTVEELEETLSPLMPQLGAALSDTPGMGLEVSSAEGSATLDSRGLTVTGLELGQGLGLEVGDTIVSLNGHRVDGLGSAWWILQDLIANNRDLTELRLEIYRRGARLYKTYPIAWR